jgi:hypothetical protein
MKLCLLTCASACLFAIGCAATQPAPATPENEGEAMASAPAERAVHGDDSVEMTFDESAPQAAPVVEAPATSLSPTSASKGSSLDKRY